MLHGMQKCYESVHFFLHPEEEEEEEKVKENSKISGKTTQWTLSTWTHFPEVSKHRLFKMIFFTLSFD